MVLSHLGEFGIIERIKNLIASPVSDVQIGIGDDAAVFTTHPECQTVITTDALVEDVHFDLSYTPIESIGWKLIAVNLSDIAAMGGIPKNVVINLALTETWSRKRIDLLAQGIADCCKQYSCDLIGGDTVRSLNSAFFSATVTGEVEPECCVKRSGAEAGDLICITGVLGKAKAGLQFLSSYPREKDMEKAVNHFLYPRPRVKEARILVKEADIHAMIDISDGLASEINHICASSEKGCIVYADKIPVAKELKKITKKNDNPLFFEALQSGEEYELLFTLSEESFKKLKEKNLYTNNLITVIGEITNKTEGTHLLYDRKKVAMPTRGWNHFNTG